MPGHLPSRSGSPHDVRGGRYVSSAPRPGDDCCGACPWTTETRPMNPNTVREATLILRMAKSVLAARPAPHIRAGRGHERRVLALQPGSDGLARRVAARSRACTG